MKKIITIIALGIGAAGCASLCDFEAAAHKAYVKDGPKVRPQAATDYEAQVFYPWAVKACAKNGVTIPAQ